MSGAKKSQFQVDYRELSKLERKISADEHGGIMHRWLYGRELLKAKAGRKQLPDGMIDDLVKVGDPNGKTISAREIQYRVKFAETYLSDQQVRKLSADLGSWNAIIVAGFPEVIVDEPLFDLDEINSSAPDEWEQLSLLPGFAPEIKVNGGKVKSVDMTWEEMDAHIENYDRVHSSYGKRLDLMKQTREFAREQWDGNPKSKVIDAYKRALST